MRSLLRRTSARLNSAIEYLLSGLGLAMSLVLGLQVFCRYVLNHSLFWSEELARAMLVWLTFLGATVAWYRQLHPGIDALTSRLSRRGRRLSRLFMQVMAMALFSVMIIAGCRFAWFVRHQLSPALGLPRWIVPSIIPASGLVLLLHTVNLFLATRGEHNDR